MSGSFTGGALKLGIAKMVDAACADASSTMTAGQRLTQQEKDGVKGLLCESMTFVAKIVVERSASPADVGAHLASNGISLGKLTKDQQVYCAALKAEIALHSAKLASTAYATYIGAAAGGHGGVVAGGLTGTMVAGPGGTVAGAVIGGVVGAGGPLLLDSYEMFETVATITDLAIDHHQQCGPLAMTKIEPTRTPLPAPPLH